MSPELLDTPLSATERSQLDQLLFNRVLDDATGLPTESMESLPPGILSLPELHGFLTAVVCCPGSIPIHEYLNWVWEDDETFIDQLGEQGVDALLFNIMRLQNEIVDQLEEQTFELMPHCLEGYQRLDETIWCGGFMKGVACGGARWDQADEGTKLALVPFQMFSGQLDAEIEQISDDILEDIRLHLDSCVIEVCALARNIDLLLPGEKNVHPENHLQIKSSDLCPCGSGKAFNKCCLN